MSEVSGSGQSPNLNPTPCFESAEVPVGLQASRPPGGWPAPQPGAPGQASLACLSGSSRVAGASSKVYHEDKIVELLRAFLEHRHSTDVCVIF